MADVKGKPKVRPEKCETWKLYHALSVHSEAGTKLLESTLTRQICGYAP